MKAELRRGSHRLPAVLYADGSALPPDLAAALACTGLFHSLASLDDKTAVDAIIYHADLASPGRYSGRDQIVFCDATLEPMQAAGSDYVDYIEWPLSGATLSKAMKFAVRRLEQHRKRRAAFEQRISIEKARTRIAVADAGLDELMGLVCSELCSLTAAAGSAVVMVDGTDIVYRAAAGSLEANVGFNIPILGSLAEHVLRENTLLHSDDTEIDDRVNLEASRELGVRSMAVGPLHFRDEFVGVLKMVSPAPHHFSGADLVVLAAMTDVIGESLHREIARENLREQARRDPLTGLHNRRALDEMVAGDAVGQRRHSAVLLLDIDDFKAVNDDYGHAAGDEVLRTVGQALSSLVKPDDFVVRIGGDEFALFLKDAGNECATQTAEKVRSQIAGLAIAHEGLWLRVTVSIGVAAPPVQKDLSRLLRDADIALYAAKDAGRNAVAHPQRTNLRSVG